MRTSPIFSWTGRFLLLIYHLFCIFTVRFFDSWKSLLVLEAQQLTEAVVTLGSTCLRALSFRNVVLGCPVSMWVCVYACLAVCAQCLVIKGVVYHYISSFIGNFKIQGQVEELVHFLFELMFSIVIENGLQIITHIRFLVLFFAENTWSRPIMLFNLKPKYIGFMNTKLTSTSAGLASGRPPGASEASNSYPVFCIQ